MRLTTSNKKETKAENEVIPRAVRTAVIPKQRVAANSMKTAIPVTKRTTLREHITLYSRRIWNVIAIGSFVFMVIQMVQMARPYVMPNNSGVSAQEMGRFIHPGMTRDEVVNQIGMPDAVNWKSGTQNSRTSLLYHRKDGDLRIEFSGGAEKNRSGNSTDEIFGIVKSREFTAAASP